MSKLLVIVAHPDDAELLCYGTIKKYAEKGYECYLLLATKGEQAAVNKNFSGDRIAETKDAFKNTDIKISCLNLPDGFIRQNHSLMADLQKQIEKINPTVIITHHPDDRGLEHQDHNELGRATYSAAIRYGENLERILFAEPLFSRFISFQPNLFINIDKYYEEKTQILKCHISQEEKFFLNDKYLEIRAGSMSPYIRVNKERFIGKYELFYQTYAVEF